MLEAVVTVAALPASVGAAIALVWALLKAFLFFASGSEGGK
jgi:hypothetical protein